MKKMLITLAVVFTTSVCVNSILVAKNFVGPGFNNEKGDIQSPPPPKKEKA